ASQSDVSVYRNLLFVSGEDLAARLDCGTQGVAEPVSKDRLRGLRIFDISDISNPRNVGNVQTCRGSHTHTVVVDPRDSENVYVYISGSSPVRSHEELAGCLSSPTDPNSALFRIEVIKVPLARPNEAAIVSSPRIFAGLGPVTSHGESQVDIAAAERQAAAARARGLYTAKVFGVEQALPPQFTAALLDSIVRARGGSGAPTPADSAALRAGIQKIVDHETGADQPPMPPTQCHDITAYPAIGRAGGACEGYGFLLDIRNPANPVRISAVADSNFSYWHSATFNNDGTKILFSDEWGGGTGAKCRATDRPEWGADALFTIEGTQMRFRSYFKMPAAQTPAENCVAHNGSLVPIPGRDVMVQAWYQGGISVFDWTDIEHPREIAFFDRGPLDPTRLVLGGSWSVYWYNGVMVSSEITRGLDIFELTPSPFISRNELDAAKTVVFDYLNVQGQQKLVWPPSFPLARAYVDQLERSGGLSAGRITAVRSALTAAESAAGAQRRDALTGLAATLDSDVGGSRDAAKVRLLSAAVRDLAGASR
ncbi:MAG: LVIVD repeat-containing protein, partial [Gemmatimonadaceae bacterium]